MEASLSNDALSFLERTLPGLDRERLQCTSIVGDGSNRQFFRLTHNDRTFVLMHNPLPSYSTPVGVPNENESHLYVHSVLKAKGVRVPSIVAADVSTGLVLMEDLGDRHLCDLATTARDRGKGGRTIAESGGISEDDGPAKVDDAANGNHVANGYHAANGDDIADLEALYWLAINQLVRIQAPAGRLFDAARTMAPEYDVDFILAEESGYFYRELVVGVASNPTKVEAIAEDCLRLAKQALDGPTVLIHRDYQSRNLMAVDVAGNRELVVIDFQGARLGPPQYDLVALLYDPYATLSRSLRLRLLGYYLLEAARARVPEIPRVEADSEEARTGASSRPGTIIGEVRPAESVILSAACRPWYPRLLANAANRLMQTLGAFAKLGYRENRPGFREHIPAGLDRLEEVLKELGTCPTLHRLAAELRLRDWR